MSQIPEIGPCNLCASTQAQPVFSNGSASILQCSRCHLISATPQTISTAAIDDSLDHDEILYQLSGRVPTGKLLVFGGEMRHFRKSAKRAGWKVLEGLRQNDSIVEACVSDRLERLPDPRATIAEVWRILKPGGLAYIVTPKLVSYESMFLRGQLYSFDAGSLSNLLTSIGFINVEDLSAEALVLCARKPWVPIEDEYRPSTQPWLEGCLVRRPGETPDDQKVYFVENGRKRWVTAAGWIVDKGLRWPDDVQVIATSELDALQPGPPLP
jgi:hypothetical protein